MTRLSMYDFGFTNPFDRLRARMLPFEPSAWPELEAKARSEAELLKELGPPEVSGLGKVANLLNLPGSVAMDLISTLTGTPRNPFDQIAHPFSHRERGESIGFRDVMTQLGVRPNQETGLRGWKDPKEAALDLAGFAGDVVFDPLNLVTLGGGAIGKGGAVLRRAGAPKLSALDRIATTVDDYAKKVGTQALDDAAKAAGFGSGSEFLAKHGKEQVGGLMGLGIPFKDNFATLGKPGGLAETVAKGMGQVGEGLRYGKIPGTQFSPGQELAAMFSHATKGVRAPELNPFAVDLTKKQDIIGLGVRSDVAARLSQAISSGHDPEQLSTLGRMHLEGVLDMEKVPPAFQKMAEDAAEMVRGLRGKEESAVIRARHNGTPLERFVDPTGGLHAARKFVEQTAGHLASTMPRETYMTGVFGMTEQLRRIIADPKLKEGTWDEGMQYFLGRWGEKFIPRMNEQHLFDELLHKVRDVWTPEQLKVGGYGQHVLKDAQDGLINSEFKIAQTDAVIDSLAKLSKPTRDMKERGMSIDEVLQRAGIRSGVDAPDYSVIDEAMEGPQQLLEGRPQPPAPPRKQVEGPEDLLRLEAPDSLDSYVQRIEEPGKGRASVSKPHGVYTSPAGVESPHTMGGETFYWKKNPDANVLRLPTTEGSEAAAAMRKGAVSAGAGAHAFRHFVGDKLFEAFKGLTKRQALEYAKLIDPKLDWTRYKDVQEIAEAIGARMAKTRGYDAIETTLGDVGQKQWNEYVGLTGKAMHRAHKSHVERLKRMKYEPDFVLKESGGPPPPRPISGLLEGPKPTGYAPDFVMKEGGRPPTGLATKPRAQDGAIFRIIERLQQGGMDIGTSPIDISKVQHLQVPERIADGIINQLARAKPLHEMPGLVSQAWDTFTNAFKAGVLNWPASIMRDVMSAAAQLGLTGHFTPQAAKEAAQLVGGSIVDFRDIPVVARMMAAQGLPMTPEASTNVMRQLAYSHELVTPKSGASGAAEVAGLQELPGGAEAFAKEFVGIDPVNLKRPSSLIAGSSWNPLKTRGVLGEQTTEFYPWATAERLRQGGDSYTRMTGLITDLRRGVSPGEAARTIKEVLVDYSPSTFGAAEQKYLKKALPFYSFASRMAKFVAKELAEKPGRGISQAIQAQHDASAQELPMPAYVSQAGAIPWETLPDGTKRYITSLGLMHENPLGYLGGGLPTGAISEALSGLHPLAKLPIELATGETLFQRGPLGGRELSEMDPPIGRLLANLGLQDIGEGERARPFIGPNFEHFMANMPTSRAVTTLRTLTDPRKDFADTRVPGVPALLNTLTGARMTDVSPQAQDLAIRQRADRIALDELGGRVYQSTYIPSETKRREAARGGAAAGRIEALGDLMSVMNKRQRERDKAERIKARQQAWNQTAF